MLCVSLILIFFVYPTVNANSDLSNASVQNNENTAFCVNNDSETYVSLEVSKKFFTNDENISLTYYVKSENDIEDIDYVQNGFKVMAINIDEASFKRVFVELSCIPDEEKYDMIISITMSSGDCLTARLYAIKNEHGVFISDFSEEEAWRNYIGYAKDRNIISQGEYEDKVANEIIRTRGEGIALVLIDANEDGSDLNVVCK